MTDALPSHSYRNTRTGRVRLFSFRATEHFFLWDLVTPEGEVIGNWNKKSRLFQMVDGLSNHVIEKLEGSQDFTVERRKWGSR